MVDDWSKFDIYSIAYVPKDLTKEMLQRYYRVAVRSIYLRPSFIWGQLFQIKSWVNFKIQLRFAFRIFFNRLLKLKKQVGSQA